jgi:ABC-type transport system involved in multi-copper enzyme maturation permease subunit
MATWSLTWSGLRTVLALELRQRVRSSRWIVILVLWMVVLGGLTALIRYGVRTLYSPSVPTDSDGVTVAGLQTELAGRIMFGLVIFLVLSLGALVAPALSATSINGDRRAGVLATLQVSLLSPAEIVIGRLLAAWVTALALLVAATPFIGWAYVEGGTSFGRLSVTLLLTAVTLQVVCAVGLGWSALTARTSSSVMLTYLTVVGLGLGLPLMFVLSLPLTQSRDRVTFIETVYRPSSADPGASAPTSADASCQTRTEVQQRVHTERVWWIVAASPYVIVADASPRPGSSDLATADDPLSAIRTGVREARLGPQSRLDSCQLRPEQLVLDDQARAAQRERAGLTWPFGLAADLLLAAGCTVLAVRRLRAPAATLARGVRIG